MNTAANNLQDIYRRKVLDHSRHPHNCSRPDQIDKQATGFNPLCGDKVSVYLQVAGDAIRHAAFEGTGCAICIASASMMTVALTGQTIAQARQFVTDVSKMFADGTTLNDEVLADIGALESVRHYPSRVKCATLAWTTVAAALNDNTQTVSTEN